MGLGEHACFQRMHISTDSHELVVGRRLLLLSLHDFVSRLSLVLQLEKDS